MTRDFTQREKEAPAGVHYGGTDHKRSTYLTNRKPAQSIPKQPTRGEERDPPIKAGQRTSVKTRSCPRGKAQSEPSRKKHFGCKRDAEKPGWTGMRREKEKRAPPASGTNPQKEKTACAISQ